jgi:U4/U6.U5 tri-snRNP-associated protein 3
MLLAWYRVLISFFRTRSRSKERDSRDKKHGEDKRHDKDHKHDNGSKSTQVDLSNLDPNSEEAMMAALGIPTGFTSTKGQHVDGNVNVVANVNKSKRTYRQYMNRRGGFNRALDAEK